MEHQGTPGEGIEDGRPLEEPFAGLMCGLHFAVLDGKTTLLPVFAIPAVLRRTAKGRPREVRRIAANSPPALCFLKLFASCGTRAGALPWSLPEAKAPLPTAFQEDGEAILR